MNHSRRLNLRPRCTRLAYTLQSHVLLSTAAIGNIKLYRFCQSLPAVMFTANAGAGETYTKNREAFKKYSIMPRRLRPSKTDKDGKPVFSDASTTVLGQKLDFPLAI